jgi:hypothetical protein
MTVWVRAINFGVNWTNGWKIYSCYAMSFVHHNSVKKHHWNVSLSKIFVLVTIQGLLILMQVGLIVLKICAILHLSGV